MRLAFVLAFALLASVPPASLMLVEHSGNAAQEASRYGASQSLPKIASAPEFSLTSQDGEQISLANLRGKVVAVAFIFTRCTAACPMLTPLMSLAQDRLGRDFGSKVAFASITVDPEND